MNVAAHDVVVRPMLDSRPEEVGGRSLPAEAGLAEELRNHRGMDQERRDSPNLLLPGIRDQGSSDTTSLRESPLKQRKCLV